MNINRIRNWATPITIGTFLLAGITGILMLFKINIGISREIHEWIGVLMVLGVIFHTVSNWKLFKSYFTKPAGLSIIGVFLVLGIISFAAPAESEGGVSPRQIFQTMQNVPLTTAAQVVKTNPEAIKEKLEKEGFTVDNTNQTIKDIAISNGKNPMRVLKVVFDKGTLNTGRPSQEESVD
jgi:hypothetical protein